MDHGIIMATAADAEAVYRLYREQLGREGCFWNEHYPGPEEISYDLSRESLFVMKNGSHEIVAAISVDRDEDVDSLTCWTESLQPGGVFARLAVRPDYQNRGLAREMVNYILDVLKRRGYKSAHILVDRENSRAMRVYAHFGFRTVGTCEMYGRHFLCCEKEL